MDPLTVAAVTAQLSPDVDAIANASRGRNGHFGRLPAATEHVLLGRTGRNRAGGPEPAATCGPAARWCTPPRREPAWLPPVALRAYASTVHAADDETGEDAVRPVLPRGWVTTAWDAELHRVVRAADELTPGAAARGIA
jgi:urease accessory protein